MESVCAVIVAYNRKDLLRQCLQAVQAQTRKVGHVLVVDNASTDGTQDMVVQEFPEVEVLRLSRNQGGAGGFQEGIKRAYHRGFDWFWLMDDDAVAEKDALEQLMHASCVLRRHGVEPSLLASKVVWTDGDLHPMNIPTVKTSDPAALLRVVEMGFLLLRSASFVSILLQRRAVAQYGLPVGEYFVWNDDVEYTARILRKEIGVWVPRSVVTHMSAVKYTPSSETAPERFYYEVRNKLWMLLKSDAWSTREKVQLAASTFLRVACFARAQRLRPRALYEVLRGIKDALTKTPTTGSWP